MTAGGDVLHVDADDHPDLLWGLRGGGGNFGVVTAFTYALHPVGPVLAGGLVHPWAAAREVLRFHDAFVAAAPDELATAVSLFRDPQAGPLVSIGLCWSGDPADGERALAPLRGFGRPLADTVAVLPFADWQTGARRELPARAACTTGSPATCVTSPTTRSTRCLSSVPDMPSAASGIGLQGLRGAASRVPPDATAFPHRVPQYDFLILGQWDDPAESERNIAWARRAFAAVRPHLADAVYVNNLGAEGPDRVRAAYGANHARLAALKATYDPDNVFRLNQNIPPSR